MAAYYSDDDYESDDQHTKAEYNKLRNFQLRDYLDCPETNKLLNREWDMNVNNTIEHRVDEFFDKHYEFFKHSNTRVFARATSAHGNHLMPLVKHHLVRNYDLNMFKTNPELARPLVNSFNLIKQKRAENKRDELKRNFDYSNRKISWS